MKDETRLAPTLCPHCGRLLDAATPVFEEAKPSPGDYSLCINCAGLMVFDRTLRPVKPEPGQFERDCANDQKLSRHIAAGRDAILRLPSRPEKAGRA